MGTERVFPDRRLHSLQGMQDGLVGTRPDDTSYDEQAPLHACNPKRGVRGRRSCNV